MCSWCGVRVWIPGQGWAIIDRVARKAIDCAGPLDISHCMCSWCGVRHYGGDPKVISFAAERLAIPAGMLDVRAERMRDGGRYISVGYGAITGWAGLMKPVSPLDGLN